KQEVLTGFVLGFPAALFEKVAQIGQGLPRACHHNRMALSHFQTYFAIRSVSRLTVAPNCLKPSVVLASVWGMSATLKRSAATSTTVKLTPSTATEPFDTICAANSGGQVNQTVSQSPDRRRSAIRPIPSMWPCTR